ncbi:MAG: class I SAM-dependent methyltransferase [Planctomycetes bacterium]|nr:class I SAM-dependent methyltransferase [Planctomycetota bacterium]MBL7041541.1 class I SAM-dependent methyltransferase [Pirellulaceae bacterium]
MCRSPYVLLLVILAIYFVDASCAAAADEAKGKGPKRTPDSVFVATPGDVVAKMLEVADVKKDDIIYDPGCGDGRIVVTAAKKYGCRGVGIELSPKLVKAARANAVRNEVKDRVRILEEDIYAVDMSEATVVTLYLLPGMNVRLIPQLQKLKPGARIVAHDYCFQGRVEEPEKTVAMTSKEDAVEHHIYLWTAPLNVNSP